MDSNVGQTDIAASREAREKMDETLWWKPKSGEGKNWGENFIRALPPHVNMEGKFYFGVPLHFDVGPAKAVVPCPRKAFGELCPICVKGFDLMNSGKEELGKDMLPSWQAYINVVVLDANGQPEGTEPKVRVYGANRQVLDEILDIMEQKFGDITNLETGHNIIIRKRGSGRKGTKYQVAAADEPSAFDHPELVASLHDLTKISPYRSADVLAGLLEGEARKDPFDAVEAPAEKPAAITGPVAQPGDMTFAPPPDDAAAEEQGTPTEPDPAAKPATQEEAQEALRQRLNEGKS
jgi:hypothetical protein